jgi:hypothetical protein
MEGGEKDTIKDLKLIKIFDVDAKVEINCENKTKKLCYDTVRTALHYKIRYKIRAKLCPPPNPHSKGSLAGADGLTEGGEKESERASTDERGAASSNLRNNNHGSSSASQFADKGKRG